MFSSTRLSGGWTRETSCIVKMNSGMASTTTTGGTLGTDEYPRAHARAEGCGVPWPPARVGGVRGGAPRPLPGGAAHVFFARVDVGGRSRGSEDAVFAHHLLLSRHAAGHEHLRGVLPEVRRRAPGVARAPRVRNVRAAARQRALCPW